MSKVSENTPAGVKNTAIFVQDVTDETAAATLNEEMKPEKF